MILDPLVWLLLLPLATVALVPADARGGAAGRVVVLSYAVGTFAVAVGSLVPADLTAYAGASAGGAVFVSLSTGLLLGGMLPWPPRAWRTWIAALPLVSVVSWSVASSVRIGPLLLGAVLGSVPLLLGRVLPATAPRVGDARGADQHRTAWLVAIVAVALAVAGPMFLMMLAPLLAVAVAAWLSRGEPESRLRLVLPVVAAIASLALGALALTIAGNAMAQVATFFTTAPVSPAAERWLALFGVVTVVAMLAPWPLGKLGLGLALAPAAVVLAHRLAISVAPEALGLWLPLLGMLLVPATVVAALRGWWADALATTAVLAAFGPEPAASIAAAIALAASLAVAATTGARNFLHPGRVTFADAGWVAMLTAAGCAATVVALLAHEVVLATLLAAGLAGAAARAGALPVPS